MDGYGKRILVVDDDAGCQALLAAQLEQAGYAVHVACDGVAGADEMRKRHFDAVITEGSRSEFTGLEFVGFCEIAWPDIPVVLLTADLNDVTACADKFEAAICILKPYEEPILLKALRTVIQTASREPAFLPVAQM